jgi:hypothetical protein
MNITLNTHDYDKYIGNIYHDLRQIDDDMLIKPKKIKETLDEIENEIENLEMSNTYLLCKNVLILLRYDISNNYDNLNNISVEDILPRTWRFVKNYDDSGKFIFYEQLADIWNGPCPQGRVSRIFQFYIPHINHDDDIFKSLKIS